MDHSVRFPDALYQRGGGRTIAAIDRVAASGELLGRCVRASETTHRVADAVERIRNRAANVPGGSYEKNCHGLLLFGYEDEKRRLRFYSLGMPVGRSGGLSLRSIGRIAGVNEWEDDAQGRGVKQFTMSPTEAQKLCAPG